MTVPYTYLLKHLPTGKLYYGCRFAKNCHPSEFWIKYKTSSKYVKELIDQYGEDTFVFEIRKTFNDAKLCRLWETRVLKRMDVVNKDIFLNMTDNISISPEAASKGREGKIGIYKNSQTQIDAIKRANTGLKRSDEVKRKMSEVHLGRESWNKGIPHSEQTKMKMSASKIGKKRSKQFSDKMRNAISGRKLYVNDFGDRKLCFPGTEPLGFKLKLTRRK